MIRNLTERQVAVLSKEYNLADGHAYRKWNAAEHAVIDALPTKFRQVNRRQQDSIETDYFETFFTLAAQTLDTTRYARFPCFTASTGIEIIANYLRLNDLSVTLIEPCFDNLKDILKRHRIPLSVFPDSMLEANPDALTAFLEQTATDVLFLVSPNNPTGTTANEENLGRIIDFCARRGTMLVLDSCFRFYVPDHEVYDQYRMLAEADIDCIVIEDTGKTWPTLELKVPFLSVSDRLVGSISRINSDFLLHVSPFTVGLMKEFLDISIGDNRGYVREIVARNRDSLYPALAPTFLRPVEKPYMSVSWLRIESEMRAVEFIEVLGRQAVHALPGNEFFWTDPALGDSFVRIALMREPDMFAEAVVKIRYACDTLVSPVAK